MPTGASDYRPRVDVVARAREPLSAGDRLLNDHDHRFDFLIVPARALGDDVPVPVQMVMGRPLCQDVAPGTVLRAGMYARPEDSALWALRAEQDVAFGLT